MRTDADVLGDGGGLTCRARKEGSRRLHLFVDRADTKTTERLRMNYSLGRDSEPKIIVLLIEACGSPVEAPIGRRAGRHAARARLDRPADGRASWRARTRAPRPHSLN